MTEHDSRQKGRRTPRILVVEDNAVNRKLTVTLVEKWGFIPVVANNGQEALTALDNEHVDLILMDMQMPVMDGLEATRAIRAREAESGEHLSIVALTANAYASDRARCLSAGTDEFLSKPVDPQALHEAILRSLPAAGDARSGNAAEAARGGPVSLSEQPLFDRQGALERVDGDMEILAEIAALFLESSEAWLDELRRGVIDSDAVAIERSAHTLLGSVASFGAPSLVEAALRVKKIGASLDLSEVDSAVGDLESRVGALAKELRGFLEEGES